jgi:hypothetical protein
MRFWPKQLIGAILSKLKPSLGTTSRIVELRRKKS